MDYEKLASDVQSMEATVKEVVAIKSAIQDKIENISNHDTVKNVKSVYDFLNSPVGDQKDIVMRKAFAAALVIAKEKGIVTNVPSDAAGLASVVDEGLIRVKTNYLVGIDAISPEVAIETIIDGTEARAIAVIDKAFESGTVNTIVTEGLVKATYAIPEFGPVIGPIAEQYKPIISSVVARVEEPVRVAINTGIHIVATKAKEYAKKAINKAKEYAWSAAKNVLSIFA